MNRAVLPICTSLPYYQLADQSHGDDDNAKLIWRSNVPHSLQDLAAFHQLISDGKFERQARIGLS